MADAQGRPETEVEAMTMLLDQLPIYAMKIGYRTDSTPEEQALGAALFEVASRWNEVKP